MSGAQRALLGAIAAFLLLFGVLPMVALLAGVRSFSPVWENADAIVNTVLLGVGATVLACAVGVPLGVAFARNRVPAMLLGASLLPYAVPPYVTTIAWIALANPTTGWLRSWVPVDIYSLPGMVWVLGLHLAPVVALSVRDAAQRIDPALEEAARLCGASPARVWRDVTAPMLAPAVLTSAGFVATASIASFGVPYLLSASASHPVPVLTTRIYQALDLGYVQGRPIAAALALLLLVVGAGIPLAVRAAIGGRSYTSARPVHRTPRTPTTATLAAILGWSALAVGLPLATVTLTSLQRSTGAGVTADNLTFATWQKLAGDARVLEALGRSAWLAAGVATATALAGLIIAQAAERNGGWFARTLAAVGRAGYAIPGSVLALALLAAWSQPIRLIVADRVTLTLALTDTAWMLGIAYSIKLLALPVDGARAALRTLHPSLEEAARLSGATWARTMRDVTLPLLLPSLATAWFLVFVPSFCEVTLSVLLRGPRSEVLGTLLFYLQTYADAQSAAALAVLVAVVLLAGMGLARLVRSAPGAA